MPAWDTLSHDQREAIILAIYHNHKTNVDAARAVYEAARGVLMVGALS